MNAHLDCPGCGRLLRVNEQFAGRTVRCPSCGTAYTAPHPRDAQRAWAPTAAAEDLHIPCEQCGLLVAAAGVQGPVRCSACRAAAARPPSDPALAEAVFTPPPAVTPGQVAPAESLPPPGAARVAPSPDGPPCPGCGAPMPADAVVCIGCGLNRATGKALKTVSRRIARRVDSGRFPLAARWAVFGVACAACLVPLLFAPRDPEAFAQWLLIPAAGAALGGLLLGTLRRLTVTTDAQGTPAAIEKWWVCFIPISESAMDLTEFRTIRLTHREGGVGVLGMLLAVGLCVAGGVPAIFWYMHLLRQGVFTLDVVSRPGVDGQPLREPLTLYHGRSERAARQIGDALEEIAGLRYG